MQIVYFYQYFSTPKGSWGTRVYEFASEWVKAGHEVTVVSSVYSKSDITATKLIESQLYNGIKVKVINIYIDNRQSFLKRVWSFVAYSVMSSYFALILKADIVIASSGPITVGFPGLVARYLRRRKMVFEVRDLWPQGAIELGILRNRLLHKICYWFESQCYKASSFIITLSPGMTQDIKKRYKVQNIDDVTNAANIEMFSTQKAFNSNIVQDKKYAIYTGNIGDINNSYWLYNTAKILMQRGREDVIILMIGDGPQREELVALAKIENVVNFVYMELMPKSDLVAYIQHAFVSLVPLKGTPVLDTSSPNKFFESLAAGVPVIQNTNGWMKDFLNNHNAGFTLDPNNAQELANKLVHMFDNPIETQQMGANGSSVARIFFDKNYLANKMLGILNWVHESS